MNNYQKQAIAASKAWAEVLELMQREWECWRMFGYLVEQDFSDCVTISNPTLDGGR